LSVSLILFGREVLVITGSAKPFFAINLNIWSFPAADDCGNL
jgi:hypothetical protein